MEESWLLHMDNTVQMHKAVPPPRPWRSLIVKHQHFRQRLYYDPTVPTSRPPSLLPPVRPRASMAPGHSRDSVADVSCSTGPGTSRRRPRSATTPVDSGSLGTGAAMRRSKRQKVAAPTCSLDGAGSSDSNKGGRAVSNRGRHNLVPGKGRRR